LEGGYESGKRLTIDKRPGPVCFWIKFSSCTMPHQTRTLSRKIWTIKRGERRVTDCEFIPIYRERPRAIAIDEITAFIVSHIIASQYHDSCPRSDPSQVRCMRTLDHEIPDTASSSSLDPLLSSRQQETHTLGRTKSEKFQAPIFVRGCTE
jgi:hypothetical protein